MSAACKKLAVDKLAITCEDETLNNATAISIISYKKTSICYSVHCCYYQF